jgi:hypothetical protein
MFRIYTGSVIAFVATNQILVKIAVSQLIGNSMRSMSSAVKEKLTIAMFVFTRLPFPAVVRTGNLYFVPESFHLYDAKNSIQENIAIIGKMPRRNAFFFNCDTEASGQSDRAVRWTWSQQIYEINSFIRITPTLNILFLAFFPRVV